MSSDLLAQFCNRLIKNDRHRGKLARRQELDCFRVYDRDLPEFPFTIDRYAEHLYVAYFLPKKTPPADRPSLEQVTEAMSQALEVPLDRVHHKLRRTKGQAETQYERLAAERSLVVVKEGGLRFYVNLTDYLDTGLYLDHRLTRSQFRDHAKQRRVLNLFSYTGAFSVYAADGGASAVTSVDLSNTYLTWCQRNLELNRLFNPKIHHFVKDDVWKFLRQSSAGSYDLIILDPPTFSNSKAMESVLDIQRDHPELINETLRLLDTEGILYFSTNCRKFRLHREQIQAEFCREITQQTIPFDFQGRMDRWCFLLKKRP